MAVVKSRDMHWGLLATKDHKDVSLATIRMLLVADGANPCKIVCSSFPEFFYLHIEIKCLMMTPVSLSYYITALFRTIVLFLHRESLL